jgi:hypothetical protein
VRALQRTEINWFAPRLRDGAVRGVLRAARRRRSPCVHHPDLLRGGQAGDHHRRLAGRLGSGEELDWYRDERILPASDCRRTTSPPGSGLAHHGRHGQHAGRRLFRRFSHRNGQRSQSRCIHVPGIASCSKPSLEHRNRQPNRRATGSGRVIREGTSYSLSSLAAPDNIQAAHALSLPDGPR